MKILQQEIKRRFDQYQKAFALFAKQIMQRRFEQHE
jgi:hypothetical protein